MEMDEFFKYQPWDNAIAPYRKAQHQKRREDYMIANKMDFLYYKVMMRLHSLPYVGSKAKVSWYNTRLNAGTKNYLNTLTF